MKKVAVIHTSLAVYENMDKQLRQTISDVEIHNIIDEQMLNDVIRSGGVTPEIMHRMSMYVNAAVDMGADVILNACSSVGGAFDVARQQVSVPTLRIDEPMAEQAVLSGKRIAVYGTVATTLKPSVQLILDMAKRMDKDVEVNPYLIDGAFQVLAVEKNPEKHNRMVLDKILQTHAEYDVLVLAQASMAVLIPQIGDLGKPVLYSMASGVEGVRKMLEQ